MFDISACVNSMCELPNEGVRQMRGPSQRLRTDDAHHKYHKDKRDF